MGLTLVKSSAIGRLSSAFLQVGACMTPRQRLQKFYAHEVKVLTYGAFDRAHRKDWESHGYGLFPSRDQYFKARKAALTAPLEAAPLESGPDVDERALGREVEGRVKSLEDLLAQAKVDQERWEVVSWRPAVSEQGQKGIDPVTGLPSSMIVQLWHVKAQLRQRLDRLYQPIHVGPPLAPPTESSSTRAGKKVLFVPDTHHGYKWTEERDYLEPFHDRRACDTVLAAAKHIQPDEIHFHGDNIDNAEASTRWSKPLDLYATLQPSLYEFHWYLRQFREACPHAKIVWHEGNHENRIARLLRDNAPVLENLTAVGDDYPVLHWSRLLGLGGLGVEYVSEYPSTSWVWGCVKVHHGTVVRSGSGATTGAVARGAVYHEVFGHTHRIEVTPRTFDTPEGNRTVWIMSTGTLARLDGVLPGSGLDSNWQQGFGVAYMDAHGGVHMQAVPVIDGRCWVEGQLLEGRSADDVARELYNAIGSARGRSWPYVRRA